MGEMEFVETRNMETFPTVSQRSMECGLNEFMSTNRTGRRNAVSYTPYSMGAGYVGQTDSEREDSTVNGLTQKLQQMNTSPYFQQPPVNVNGSQQLAIGPMNQNKTGR